MQTPYSCCVAKKPAPAPEPAPISRQERIIAYMFAAILGLSIIALFALFIGGPKATGNVWSAVALVPFLGFPIAILLLIALVVLNIVRRGRAAKVAGK